MEWQEDSQLSDPACEPALSDAPTQTDFSATSECYWGAILNSNHGYIENTKAIHPSKAETAR